MPAIVADVVDAYVVRKLHARLQFLLMLRRADDPFGGTWQAIHGGIDSGETALDAAERWVLAGTGIAGAAIHSADFVNQVFDHTRDAIVLAPVLVFSVSAGTAVTPGEDFTDFAWCDRDEAIGRLPWSGQRWAVRHIDDLLGPGNPDTEFYRVR